MNALICVLFFSSVIQFPSTSFVHCEHPKLKEILTDVVDNRDGIGKIFRKVSTLNILLKNYEQSEGVLQSLLNAFKFGEKSFVIFNFEDEESYEEWTEHCQEFKKDSELRTLYYQRFYQKFYEPPKLIPTFPDDSEYQLKGLEDDPQASVSAHHVAKSRSLPESFSSSLDSWFSYRKGGFVLFCLFKELSLYLGCLLSRSGTFLFIIDTKKTKPTLREVGELLNASWNSSTNSKLFVLIFNEVYALNPFEIDETTKAFGVLKKLSKDEEVELSYRNLNRYPMRIDMFYSAFSKSVENFTGTLSSFGGPDAEVAKFIGEQMNVSMSVIKNEGKFGEKLSNGTLTGSLGNLQHRKADIAMTAFFMKDYETRACEFAFPIYMDELCVVVKKAERIPSLLLPLVIFDNYLWLNLFCSGILIGIIWSTLRFINNSIKRPSDTVESIEFLIQSYNLSPFLAKQSQLRQYTQIFIDTFMLYLSIPMRRFTRVQSERIFISAICFTSINFIALYQSGLSTVFVKPMYFKDINSLEQLDASKYIIKVKYAGYLTDVFPEESNGTIKSLHNKMKLFLTDKYALSLVMDYDNVATITRKSTVQLDNANFFINRQLHIIDKECPRNYFLAYMLPVNSGYLERVNEILMDIQRYGFILKWIDDINFSMTLTNLRNFRFDSSKAKTLTLEDLKLPFLVLVSGNGLGVVIIVLELLINIRGKRKKIM